MVRLTQALWALDDVLRLHQVGFTAIWPLVGLAVVEGWSRATVVSVVVALLSLHATVRPHSANSAAVATEAREACDMADEPTRRTGQRRVSRVFTSVVVYSG